MSHNLAAQEFHNANAHVCDILIDETLRLQMQGVTNISMDKLFGKIRWSEFIQTDSSGFKMNNNYSSFYARLVMEKEPRLEGIFVIRQLNTGREDASIDLQAAFEKHNGANPRIYNALVKAARRLKLLGTKKIGIKGLAKDNGIRYSNSYNSLYARLIMEEEKNLKGFFTLRELKNTIGQ